MPENRYSGDVFGKNIADSTRNDADLAGHYPYSQERWRLFETDISESNRIFLEYNQDARYQHQAMPAGVSRGGAYDVHTITPNAGETMYFKTSERFRYVVGYESRGTWALQLSQDLQGDDEFEIGLFSNFGGTTFQNGYGFYFDADLSPLQTEFRLYRSGSVQNRKTLNLSIPITSFTRLEWRYAWYNIMGCIATQSYNFDNWQLGTLKSDDNQRGPDIGNFNIAARMKVGSGTTGLNFQLGSAAWQTWGNVDTILRTKTVPATASYGGSGEYEPLLVIRKDPNREFIKAEFDRLDVDRFTGQDDFFLVAQVVSRQNVRDSGGNLLDDTDFSVSAEVSATNSILEVSENAAQFPDNTGTLVTTTLDPGGYQVAFGARYQDQGSAKVGSTPRTVKRAINNGDYVIILGRTAGTTSGTVKYEIVTEQDW